MRYSIYNGDSTKRYVLGICGTRPLIILGCNPHKATGNDADQTSIKVEKIAKIYKKTKDSMTDGFVLINIYPARSKTARDLPIDGTENSLLIEENLRVIDDVAENIRPLTIWAAWGADIQERHYLRATLSRIICMLQRHNPHWVRFGDFTPVTLDPRHPSRIGYNNTFSELSVSSYLDLNACGVGSVTKRLSTLLI